MSEERFDLIIELEGTWPAFQRRYTTPDFGDIFPTPQDVRLDTLGVDYSVGGATGLAAIQGVLARGSKDELTTHLSGARLDRVGAILFEALLGDEATWAPVLRRVFRQPKRQPNPDRGPVRVRIRTRDALLQGLPWRAVMWESTPLADSGWTFEIDLDLEDAQQVELKAPGSILVIAPDYPAYMPPIGTEPHVRVLSEAFDRISPGRGQPPYFQVAKTGEEVRSKLGDGPDIVYFFGHGDAKDGQLRLILWGPAGEDPVLARDLAAWLAAHPPRLAYFNGCQTGQAGWHSAGFQIVKKKVRVVVTNATSAWSGAAGSFAVYWFMKWLAEGLDPVAALHSREIRPRTDGFEWTTPIVHASYPSWTTHRPRHGVAGALPGPPEDWFDRKHQRAQGSFDVLELVHAPHRRVLAAATCAAPGNHLDRLARQIINSIERHSGHEVHAKHVPLRFPQQRDPSTLAANLEQSLTLQLARKANAKLADVLDDHARRCPPKVTAVLWADWGVFDNRPGSSNKLSPEELRAFLVFARKLLAPACRAPRLRVVTSLAIEQAAEKIEALHGTLQGYENGTLADSEDSETSRTPAFVFKVIPPPKDVEPSETSEYLEQADCGAGYRGRLVRAIHARTRGRYSETVALLKRGHTAGWYALWTELEQPMGKAPDDGF